jgi:hypothetical protein
MKRLLTFLIIPLFLAACSEPILPKLIKSKESYDKYLIHYEYQTEQWDDPDILSTPRLQFTWTKPGDSESQQGLWSMKLDGTDLREVATPAELEGPEKGFYRPEVPFVRSPDNRYVAYISRTETKYQRRILDLKTRQVSVIADGPGPPNFQWFKEGRFLLFAGPGPMFQYDMQTQKISKIVTRFVEDGYMSNYQSYDNGNQLVWRDIEYTHFYDFDSGEEVRQIKRGRGTLTKDKKYWLISDDSRSFGINVAKLATPSEVLFKLPKGMSSTSISAISGRDYIFSKGGRASIKRTRFDKTKIEYWSFPGDAGVGSISIYNAKAALEQP